MLVLILTHKLVYLVFKMETCQMTIQLTLTVDDQLFYLLGYMRQGSQKGRQRIASYAQWILVNLRLPHFLAMDILLGEPTWVLTAMRDLSVLQLKQLMDQPITVNLFTDAIRTPRRPSLPPWDCVWHMLLSIPKKLTGPKPLLRSWPLVVHPKVVLVQKTTVYYGNSHSFGSKRNLKRTYHKQDPRKKCKNRPHPSRWTSWNRGTWRIRRQVHQDMNNDQQTTQGRSRRWGSLHPVDRGVIDVQRNQYINFKIYLECGCTVSE